MSKTNRRPGHHGCGTLLLFSVLALGAMLAAYESIGGWAFLLPIPLVASAVALERGVLAHALHKRLLESDKSPRWIETTHEWQQATSIKISPARLLAVERSFGMLAPTGVAHLHLLPPRLALRNRHTVALLLRFLQREKPTIAAIYNGKRPVDSDAYRLFADTMRTQLAVSELAVLVGLVYLDKEVRYLNVRHAIGLRTPTDFDGLIAAIVDHDTMREVKTPEAYIERMMTDFRVSRPIFSSIQRMYAAELDRRREAQFVAHLQDSSVNQSLGDVDQRVRQATWEVFLAKTTHLGLEVDLEQYIVVGRDHSRTSPVDQHYRKACEFALASAFNNACVHCGNGLQQLEFDHFWLPKKQGGNFAMRHRSGVYVNNCVPLCRSCNASKGARPFIEFFGADDVERIVAASQSLNPFLNTAFLGFGDEGWAADSHERFDRE